MTTAELVDVLAHQFVVAWDPEHDWRLLPAPPEWWWDEAEE